MIRKKVDSSLECQFLTALIMSKPFLAAIHPVLDVSLLQIPYLRQIATWCLKYFQEYGEAPGKSIESLYHAWVENETPEEADADAVGAFLGSLSSQYDTDPQINVPFLLNEAAKYLTLKKVGLLRDKLADHLMCGRAQESLTDINSFRTVDLGDGVGYNPTMNKEAVHEAFADLQECVVPFPKVAGEFLNPGLTRDSLIGIQGPEKRGKTWWCLEFVYRALRKRSKVAMFEVGDLSKGQLTKRMLMRMAELPLWQTQCDKVIDLPIEIEVVDAGDGKRKADVTPRHKKFKHPLDIHSGLQAQRKFRRRHALSDVNDYVMFSVHANSSINVQGIDAILQRWQYERNFVPDVIVIDYADILAPEDPKKDPRETVNDTWKALRRLSQEWHACVIVPTQANAASYDVKTQSMKNFSNDKRKLAHVTGMLGLNQTEEEKKQAVMRLNWIVLRESEFHASDCLWVAQCLPLGMAFVCAAR